jgi:hypothetical protein
MHCLVLSEWRIRCGSHHRQSVNSWRDDERTRDRGVRLASGGDPPSAAALRGLPRPASNVRHHSPVPLPVKNHRARSKSSRLQKRDIPVIMRSFLNASKLSRIPSKCAWTDSYSAARNLGYTFARTASFAGKALGLAGHAASPRPSPRALPRGAGRRPSSDSPPDCAVPGDLSPILRTAQ